MHMPMTNPNLNAQSTTLVSSGMFIAPVFNGNGSELMMERPVAMCASHPQPCDSYKPAEVRLSYIIDGAFDWNALGLHQKGFVMPSSLMGFNNLKSETLNWRVKYYGDKRINALLNELSALDFEEPELAVAASFGDEKVISKAMELGNGELPSLRSLANLGFCKKCERLGAAEILIKELGVPVDFIWKVIPFMLGDDDLYSMGMNKVINAMNEVGIFEEHWGANFDSLSQMRTSDLRCTSRKALIDALRTARAMGFEERYLGAIARVILNGADWADMKGEEVAEMIMQSIKGSRREIIETGSFIFPCGLKLQDALEFWYILQDNRGYKRSPTPEAMGNRIGAFMLAKGFGISLEVAERLSSPLVRYMSEYSIPKWAWMDLAPVISGNGIETYFEEFSKWREAGWNWEEHLALCAMAGRGSEILGVLKPSELREFVDLREHEIDYIREMAIKIDGIRHLTPQSISSAYEEMRSKLKEQLIPHYIGTGEAIGLEAYVWFEPKTSYGVMEISFDVHESMNGIKSSVFRRPLLSVIADVVMSGTTLYVHAIRRNVGYQRAFEQTHERSEAALHLAMQCIERWAGEGGYDQIVINIMPGIIDDIFYANVHAPSRYGYRLVEGTEEILDAHGRIQRNGSEPLYWQKTL